MLASLNPNQLLVEGQDDLFAVAGLMKAHVDWPEGPGSSSKAPVFIHNGNGAPEILKQGGLLGVFLKSPVLRTGGLILDADQEIAGRYESVRRLMAEHFADLPLTLPAEGLVVENEDNKRFGVWIMPDNASDGILETFLKWLVPAPRASAWNLAEKTVSQARAMGCECRDCHVDKANLYTWLAWQDPPGQSPGIALTKTTLDPSSPNAAAFVAWFVKLYQLPPKANLFS